MKVLCYFFPNDVDVQLLGDIFYQYTPQMAFRGRRALLLEVSKGRKLYSAEHIQARGLVYLKKLMILCRSSLATDAPTALALAAFNKSHFQQLPLESLIFFVSPFRTDEFLEKQLAQMILYFQKLGLRYLKDVQTLSRASLSARFGTLGGLIHQNLLSASDLLWPVYVPNEVVEEKVEFDFEYPVHNTEPILFYLKTILEKIAWRLRGQGKRLKSFYLEFKLENKDRSGSDLRRISISLSNGILSPKMIFAIAREQMDHQIRQNPFTARISAFRLVVQDHTPFSVSQRDLFDPKNEEDEEGYASLVSRMRIRLGDQAVFKASAVQSYIPELNWQKQQHNQLKSSLQSVAESREREFLPRRPLRLFKMPIPVQAIAGFILWNGQSVALNPQGQEIIFSDWWNEKTERIYFRLKTQTQEILWLFKCQDQFFIHGVFD